MWSDNWDHCEHESEDNVNDYHDYEEDCGFAYVRDRTEPAKST
jgi:hypothetical protein